MSAEHERKAVHVAAVLYDRVAKRVSAAGFDSVDESVTFVLEEVLRDDSEEDRPTFREEEEEEVKKRLRALGYLDWPVAQRARHGPKPWQPAAVRALRAGAATTAGG